MRYLFLPVAIMLVVSACGKTGELYLPDDKKNEAPVVKKEASTIEEAGE